MKKLEGADRQRLRQILLRLLSLKQLDMLLADSLDRDRETIALGDDKEEIFFRVITEANKGVWVAELVEAARRLRPRDADLYEFAREFFDLGVAGTPSGDVLERIVVPASRFLQVAEWRTRLAAIERRVCRISYPLAGGTCYGTGFLVAPSVIVTNYHVIEPIVGQQAKPESVTAQFDYKVVDNKTLEGRLVKLATDWLIDSSPYAAADVNSGVAVRPTEEELDYAFLRLAEAVGDEPIGTTSDPSAEKRGWISLGDAATSDPAEHSAVLIVQHPKGSPLALAMEMQGLLASNANGTRIRYSTNTERGSSGSPVFDIDWQLFALHHTGDPDFSQFHKPEYNQGIPIRLIVALLKKRQKLTAVGG